MKTVLIPIAEGSEEIEAVTLINVLRRAGFQVTVAGVSTQTMAGSHQIALMADKLLSDCQSEHYDGIFLPGGMPGATHLSRSTLLISMLKAQAQAGKYYGAICASPAVVLAEHGLLAGKKATVYPGLESGLPPSSLSKQEIVVDGHCITAQSPRVAMDFALTIVRELAGSAQADEVRKALC